MRCKHIFLSIIAPTNGSVFSFHHRLPSICNHLFPYAELAKWPVIQQTSTDKGEEAMRKQIFLLKLALCTQKQRLLTLVLQPA
jgi:hypothetical protein